MIRSGPPQFLADFLARAMQGGQGFTARRELAFPEIPGNTTDVTVPTRHGDVAARWYRPTSEAGELEKVGVHVNFHGGGYVVRRPEQDDALCRYLAHHTGLNVLNVDYDTAPAARFPVPVEEAFDVVVWAGSAGRPWDNSRVSIGGQSAGGAIAAAVCRMGLTAGGGLSPLLQVLLYPPLDLVTPASRKPVPGGRRSAIPAPLAAVFDAAYVPDLADRQDILVSPAWGGNATGLTGIAPAVVVTAEYDRLRAEGVRYARALASAGALISHLDVPGVDHGFNLTDRSAGPQTDQTYRVVAAALTAAHDVDSSGTACPGSPVG